MSYIDPLRNSAVRTRREHIDARAVVREIGALITEGGSADSDSLLRSSGGVVACVLVVIACVDGLANGMSCIHIDHIPAATAK